MFRLRNCIGEDKTTHQACALNRVLMDSVIKCERPMQAGLVAAWPRGAVSTASQAARGLWCRGRARRLRRGLDLGLALLHRHRRELRVATLQRVVEVATAAHPAQPELPHHR